MKVKTITCHDVYNFGASLQTYALMKYLQISGHDVEIIDYMPPYMVYKMWSIGKRWKKNSLLAVLFYLYVIPIRLMLRARRKKFDQFTKEQLVLTKSKFGSNKDLKDKVPFADIYFAGSDQIWNVEHNHGKDPAFYLDFAPSNAVKASYAASFSISQLPEEYHSFVKSKLENLDRISVREGSGLNILKELNIKDGVVVVDPVFLIGIEQWEQLATYEGNEKYILIYDQENNPLIKETAKRISKEQNLKIYAIKSLYPMRYAHKRIIDGGPMEFLGLLKNCEICLTNSFHCTAFSIIFRKEFYTFKRTHEKVNSRMIDLLDTLGLGNRIFNNYESMKNIEQINYETVADILQKQIDSSKEYINQVIDIAKINE